MVDQKIICVVQYQRVSDELEEYDTESSAEECEMLLSLHSIPNIRES